jgi:cystathionine beta-lyase
MTDAFDRRQGHDPVTLRRHFGTTDVLPLWIAEPELNPPPVVVDALRARADEAWYGYEIRPESVVGSFWRWCGDRHDWHGTGLSTRVSPSVGTSIGSIIELTTEPGDGVILQPPVFTDFKPLVESASRTVVRNPLVFDDGGYRLDLDHLATLAADPANRLLVLCNPHNPVGRVWTADELDAVARVCAEHDVFVLADEIHADLALAPHRFTPFATAAHRAGVNRWAATHGPIKTFALAGVCDTLLITGDATLAERFDGLSSRLHLTRNNVFAIAAFETAYDRGGPWLDDLLDLVARNVSVLRDGLPDRIRLVEPDGTYLAWIDLRALGLDVPEIPRWLADRAGVALSPGHWFGREGAGFARMTVAAPTAAIEHAVERLTHAAD